MHTNEMLHTSILLWEWRYKKPMFNMFWWWKILNRLFVFGGLILRSSQFLLLPQQHLKMTLAIKVVKIDPKIIISIPQSKLVKQTVWSSKCMCFLHTKMKSGNSASYLQRVAVKLATRKSHQNVLSTLRVIRYIRLQMSSYLSSVSALFPPIWLGVVNKWRQGIMRREYSQTRLQQSRL